MRRIKHKIRSSYGYTENQLLDHIQEYGEKWVIEAYKEIMEEEYENIQVAMAIAVLARTPQSKKGVKAMERYTKSLVEGLEKVMIPWIIEEKRQLIKERLSSPPEPKIIVEGDISEFGDLEELARTSDLKLEKVE